MFVETTVWVWQRSSSFPSSTNPVGEGCQGSNKASTAAESAGRVREMSAAVVECEEVERGCHCRIAHLHSLGGGCSSSAAQLELSARQSQGQHPETAAAARDDPVLPMAEPPTWRCLAWPGGRKPAQNLLR